MARNSEISTEKKTGVNEPSADLTDNLFRIARGFVTNHPKNFETCESAHCTGPGGEPVTKALHFEPVNLP